MVSLLNRIELLTGELNIVCTLYNVHVDVGMKRKGFWCIVLFVYGDG